MCIAADAGDALESEVEELGLEAGFLEEGHKEGTETAVNVQRNLALHGEFGEGGYVVDNPVGKVGRGADEEYGVAVDEAGDAWDVDLVGRCWAGDEVHLDAKVGACLAERGVCCLWENPERILACVTSRVVDWFVHFWLSNASVCICLLSST